MKVKTVLKREYEVAFAKNAQPAWLRITKYTVVVILICIFWQSRLFWIILTGAFLLSLAVHLWYRYKTKAWTKSFGGWDYEKNKPRQQD